MIATALTAPVAEHGEGPCWFPDGTVRWVDMLRGDVLVTDPASGETARQHVGDVVAMVRPRTVGGMVVALERGFALVSDAGRVEPLGDLWPSEAGVRMNDGGCDARGRVYAGSMVTHGPARSGALWRLDPGGGVVEVLAGVGIANGLAWNAAGTAAYFVDSADGRVDVLEFDADGELADRRTLVDIPARCGAPDGLCLDAEDGVWVALWDGGAVHRYDPFSGRLTARVEVPVARPTACAFGGPGLDELFISSSRPADGGGLAGSLFVARPGVRGAPPYAFAG